jgi:di/tricarboxylate transporter
MPKFGLLELTPIGLALVLGGIAYLSTVGRAMLSKLSDDAIAPFFAKPDEVAGMGFECYEEICGPYEIYVPRNYQAGREPQEIVDIRCRFLVNIVAISTEDGNKEVAPAPSTVLRGGLVVCAYGPEIAIKAFARDNGLVLRDEPRVFKNDMFDPAVAGTAEVIIAPRSSLIGETLKDIQFRETFAVNALGLHQDGRTYYRDLAERPLRSGDAIFIQGTWEQIHALQESHQNFIVISALETEFQQPEKMNRALACFLGTLVLMLISSFHFQSRAYNPIPLSVCLMAGAIGMVFTKVLTIGEAYRAVDWRTVFLLAGLIPLGMAIDQTGTAEWIARGIVGGLGEQMTPLLLLLVLACLSLGFTLVISNVGACALLVPLGMSMASKIGIDPRVAAIVVGLGVSNSFILPTHQVNALYMGPGNYRTKDYLKIGGFLSLIYVVILVAMTYFFYL